MLKEQSLSTHRPIESRVKFHNLQNISEAFKTKKQTNIAAFSSTTEEDEDWNVDWIKTFLPAVCAYLGCRRSALPGLEQEYRFWMQNRSVAVRLNGAEHVLNRYDVQVGLPR